MKQRTPEEMKAIIDAYVAKKRETGEQPDPDMFTRYMSGITGLGMLRGNVSPVVAGLTGRASLWHGSPSHNILPNATGEGILSEGLNLRHAGKNQRANSLLMRNSLQSLLEEVLAKKGRKLTPDDEEHLYQMIGKLNHDAGADTQTGMVRSAVGAGHGASKDTVDAAAKAFGSTGDALKGHLGSAEEILKMHEAASMRDSAGNFKSVADRVMDRIPELSKRYNVPEHELKEYFDKNIGRLGKRIYFGTSPESVAYWSGMGNEAGYAAGKAADVSGAADLLKEPKRPEYPKYNPPYKNDDHSAWTKYQAEHDALLDAHQENLRKYNKDKDAFTKAQDSAKLKSTAKDIGKGMLNQATGGYANTLEEKLKYGRPESTLKLPNVEALKAHLHAMGDELHNHNVLMNFSVPSGTLDSMADFPVVRRVIQSSPGLKDMMGRFFPQADPSKDLSVSENVSHKRLKAVDLVDKTTGKVKQRIHLENYEKAPLRFLGGKGNRLNTLKNIAAPAALSIIGGNLIHKAFSSKHKGPKLADKIKDVSQESTDKKNVKKAAADPKIIAALLGIPTVAGLGFAGGSYLADKAMNRKPYYGLPKELESKFTPAEKEEYMMRAAKENVKGMIGGQMANAVGTGLGTFADRLPASLAATAGGYVGSQLMVPAVSSQISMAENNPDTILPFASKFPKIDKFIRNHPYITGGAAAGLTLGALPASVYHIGKKYYPYHTMDIMKKINGGKSMKEGFGSMMEDLKKHVSKGTGVGEHMKNSLKHLKHTMAFPAIGLGVAGLSAGVLAGVEKARSKINRHMDENREEERLKGLK